MRQVLNPVAAFSKPGIRQSFSLASNTTCRFFQQMQSSDILASFYQCIFEIINGARIAFLSFNSVRTSNVQADSSRRMSVGIADHSVICGSFESFVMGLAALQIRNDGASFYRQLVADYSLVWLANTGGRLITELRPNEWTRLIAIGHARKAKTRVSIVSEAGLNDLV